MTFGIFPPHVGSYHNNPPMKAKFSFEHSKKISKRT
jgi:hypothetical protein